MSGTADAILNRVLFVDVETTRSGRLLMVGALFRGERYKSRVIRGETAASEVALELAEFAAAAVEDGARYLGGHNLTTHDIPILKKHLPRNSRMFEPLPLDTLHLSPLAFPENPYHRLVKDYKLESDATPPNPLRDCELCAQLLMDEIAVFESAEDFPPRLLGFLGHSLAPVSPGFERFFVELGAPRAFSHEQAAEVFAETAAALCCEQALKTLTGDPAKFAVDSRERARFAFALAWLRVSGGNSILPPWVFHHYAAVEPLLRSLRDFPCGAPDGTGRCAYCATAHDPKSLLRKYFNFEAFLPAPVAADGGSLQERIVGAAIRDESLLAILPTGGGKSLCYQLPALARNFRTGSLTVVISPLQALMKDQVDRLNERCAGFHEPGALMSGMQTRPERAEAMRRVRMGDAAILYVSPEQLRNKSFRKTILSREVSCWVFDEAHCLSKWGHDFRPDYLYASRFIREFSEERGMERPIVQCFTATAKRDVVEEIIAHFETTLGLKLAFFDGGAERTNLRYEVRRVKASEKWNAIRKLLSERLGKEDAGIVFAATRNAAEEIAGYLAESGFGARAFHAGLDSPEKREIQDAFISGETQIVVATNAFGMGIDKENVRLVVHADIPGSLENYLQEAGRAGRDRKPADCVLLYDENDVERQFQLSAGTRLTHKDVVEIFKALKRARRNKKGEVVITYGEILRDERTDASFDPLERNADTKVKTAVALLERGGFLKREENQTNVFQGRPLVANLDEAKAEIARMDVPPAKAARWLAVLRTLMNAPVDGGVSADDLASSPEFMSREAGEGSSSGQDDTVLVMKTLDEMNKRGLIKSDMLLSAFVRYKTAESSKLLFATLAELEAALLEIAREEAEGETAVSQVDAKNLADRLRGDFEFATPDLIRSVLSVMERDASRFSDNRRLVVLRKLRPHLFQVELKCDWDELLETLALRRAVAGTTLDAILAKIPADTPPSSKLLVEFSESDIFAGIAADMFVSGAVGNRRHESVGRALMRLHSLRVLLLQKGLAVFRQAMTVKMPPESRVKRFTAASYKPLEEHYAERVYQIHVMNEYARTWGAKLRDALAMMEDYFKLEKLEFTRKYFSDREDVIARATGIESYRKIVESLNNPAQTAIVSAPKNANMLVLAGPGSGKTKVVVHRCAYLLRVERVRPSSILILCFNRNSSIELRRRLAELVGADARGVVVRTYHGFAMTLAGASLDTEVETADVAATGLFDGFIEKAIAVLKGGNDPLALSEDEARSRLLGSFEQILVDEYQDVNALQYELISAIAGRTLDDPESRLAITAVGDDDQNIYTFLGSSVEYIRRFQEDYDAETHYLVDNYRSTPEIIAASNRLISLNGDRMKTNRDIRPAVRRTTPKAGSGGSAEKVVYPMEIQPATARALAAEPATAGFAAAVPRLPTTHGKPLVIRTATEAAQALSVSECILEIRKRDSAIRFSDFAVLSRSNAPLATIRTLLESRSIPVRWTPSDSKFPPIHVIREVRVLFDLLDSAEETEITVAELRKRYMELFHYENRWTSLGGDILDMLELEQGGDAGMPPFALKAALRPVMTEFACAPRIDAVHLGTAHSAKGLEFDHVFILDDRSGWKINDDSMEEERRLHYVAMTRARKTLVMFEDSDIPNPFTTSLGSDVVDKTTAPHAAGLEIPSYEYGLLGLEDLFISFAGHADAGSATNDHLAELSEGDRLVAMERFGSVALLDDRGCPVAKLSKKGRSKWGTLLLSGRAELTVAAMVVRSKAASEEEYRSKCKRDFWEVPICEIRHPVRPRDA